MASSALPSPGSELGPCRESCGHRDCALTRADAARPCRFCGEAIGYGRHYYNDRDHPDGIKGALCHAACFEGAIEKERAFR